MFLLILAMLVLVVTSVLVLYVFTPEGPLAAWMQRNSENAPYRDAPDLEPEEALAARKARVAQLSRKLRIFTAATGSVLALLCFAATSWHVVPDGQTGHLHRIFMGKPLPDGRIIALKGEMGPQAEILPPGFHFRPFIQIVYKVENRDIVSVPTGKYALLNARDGKAMPTGQTFADLWQESQFDQMWGDAEFFLTNGGQKGPQTSILPPGNWRLNLHLWEVVGYEDITEIPAGHVGVITSAVHSAVDFGNLRRPKPTSVEPVLSEFDGEALSVPLVPVGAIGVWSEPLLPGRYYINNRVYKVSLIDTRIQTREYKGGYESAEIELTVSSEGEIEQRRTAVNVPVPPGAADQAVSVTMEGWTVYQELRVLFQTPPEWAPYVIAAVGGLEEIEERILTPNIRSVVRNVLTSEVLEFPGEDRDGSDIIETRRARALDPIHNRPVLENRVAESLKREGRRAFVQITDVRFGEADIPPELLVARRREQLAQQLARAFKQEQESQTQRIASEQARATAAQQSRLVEAQIEVARSEQLMQARANEGEGERKRLEAIAAGEEARKNVLGEANVVSLRRYELMLERFFSFAETPDGARTIQTGLTNAHKFVPERTFVIGSQSDGGGLFGLAGLISELFNNEQTSSPKPAQ